MKRFPQMQLLALLGVVTLSGCSKPDAPESKPAAAESLVKSGAVGAAIVTLSAATQQVIGLQVAPLRATELRPEVKAFGSVVDPAPLSDALMELGRAQLTYDTTHRELERMKVLRKDQNTSERAFEATEAQYRLDMAAIYAIRMKIQRAWGSRLAELTGPIVVPVGTDRKPDVLLSELVDGNNTMLVRVDLPAGEVLAERPVSARLVGFAANAIPVEAQFLDDAPTIDPKTQTRGMFFVAKNLNAGLTPGLAVTAFIKTEQAPENGVVVPREAIVRSNGAAWIYLQTGAEEFQRVRVTLDRALPDGWFVHGGVTPNDKVVIVGAQLILSTEMNAAGFSDGEHH